MHSAELTLCREEDTQLANSDKEKDSCLNTEIGNALKCFNTSQYRFNIENIISIMVEPIHYPTTTVTQYFSLSHMQPVSQHK